MTEKGRHDDPTAHRTPDRGAEVAETVRRRIIASVERVLEIEDPLARLEALVDGLLGELEGAPELAVALATDPMGSPGSGGRDRLVSTIRNLMASLVGDALVRRCWCRQGNMVM